MPWRNLKTQFITRFFRIRHDNKILFYFNICTGLARETIIDEFYQAGYVFTAKLSFIFLMIIRGLWISCCWSSWPRLPLGKVHVHRAVQPTTSGVSQTYFFHFFLFFHFVFISTSRWIRPPASSAARAFYLIYRKSIYCDFWISRWTMYVCTFPVVVVHGLMTLKDQISVKSLPVFMICLKFCRADCHNETILKSKIFHTYDICNNEDQEHWWFEEV